MMRAGQISKSSHAPRPPSTAECGTTRHISGHAGGMRVPDRFLADADRKPGLVSPQGPNRAPLSCQRADTPIVERGSPTVTGLPGPMACDGDS